MRAEIDVKKEVRLYRKLTEAKKSMKLNPHQLHQRPYDLGQARRMCTWVKMTHRQKCINGRYAKLLK